MQMQKILTFIPTKNKSIFDNKVNYTKRDDVLTTLLG